MSVVKYRILGRDWAPESIGGYWCLGAGRAGGFYGWESLGIVKPKKFIRSLGVTPVDSPGWGGQCPWFTCEADVRRVATYLVALDKHRLCGLPEGV